MIEQPEVSRFGSMDVPRIQKNAQLDVGLWGLVDSLLRQTGATFSRLVTANLLRHMFGTLQPPDDALGTSYDSIWMELAVDLERETISILDVPGKLFEAHNASTSITLRHANAIPNPTPELEELKSRALGLRGFIHGMEYMWKEACEREGGIAKGLDFIITHGGFPPPQACGVAGAIAVMKPILR